METPLTTGLSSLEGFWGGIFTEREDVTSVGEGVLPEEIVLGERGERRDGEKASGRMEVKLVDAWDAEVYGWAWTEVVEEREEDGHDVERTCWSEGVVDIRRMQ